MRWLTTLARRWAYLLALSPIVTDWLETGHFPRHPVEYTTEVVVGLLLLAFITIMYRDMDRLKTMAETDGLTGLYNRRKFMEDIEAEVEMAHRLGGLLSLMYLDIDGFKRINDRYGHNTGDSVLRHVAALLMGCARRRIDRSYRLGGDEFALLLPGVDANGTTQMIRRLLSARDAPALRELQRFGVSLSFGTAQLRPEESSDAFLHRADAEMYRVKQHLRNARESGPTTDRHAGIQASA